MRRRIIGQCQMCALKILQTASCVLGERRAFKRCQHEQLEKRNGEQVLDDEEWFKEAYQRPRQQWCGELGTAWEPGPNDKSLP